MKNFCASLIAIFFLTGCEKSRPPLDGLTKISIHKGTGVAQEISEQVAMKSLQEELANLLDKRVWREFVGKKGVCHFLLTYHTESGPRYFYFYESGTVIESDSTSLISGKSYLADNNPLQSLQKHYAFKTNAHLCSAPTVLQAPVNSSITP